MPGQWSPPHISSDKTMSLSWHKLARTKQEEFTPAGNTAWMQKCSQETRTASHCQISILSTFLHFESSSHWRAHWCTTLQDQSLVAQLWKTKHNHPGISLTHWEPKKENKAKPQLAGWGSLLECHHWTLGESQSSSAAHQWFWWTWLHFTQFQWGCYHSFPVPWEHKNAMHCHIKKTWSATNIPICYRSFGVYVWFH